MCLMLYEVETNRVWHWFLIAGVTLTGEDLGIAGNSVSASDGLVSYYPEFSGFGEFRNGEPVAMQPRPVALWPLGHKHCHGARFPLRLQFSQLILSVYQN